MGGIIAGSCRDDTESNGTDILGAGNWESSLLYEFIFTAKSDVPGHTDAIADLLIFAGKPLPVPDLITTPISTGAPTATPIP